MHDWHIQFRPTSSTPVTIMRNGHLWDSACRSLSEAEAMIAAEERLGSK